MQLTLKLRAFIAEFVGTFFLTFAVLVSLNSESALATPIVAALTLGLFVYSIGHVSGTHINPAVTIGLASIRKIDVANAVGYIISQFLGAGLAMLAIGWFVGEVEMVKSETNILVFSAELVGTLVFTFGIASVVYSKVGEQMSGVVVGGSLLLGIILASVASGGVLNPAVAMGIGSFSAAYALGPLAGAIVGFNLYLFLKDKTEKSEKVSSKDTDSSHKAAESENSGKNKKHKKNKK